MNKLASIFNISNTLILICLGLLCLTYYFVGAKPVFDTQIISELLPIQGVIDVNELGELSSTIFLIRQHFDFFPNQLSMIPYISHSILSVLGISCLIISLKKWAQISWIFIMTGILLWLAIILIQNNDQSMANYYEVVFSQINWLGILCIFILTILCSSSISQFLLALGHAESKKESQKKWLILFGILAINLIFSFGHLIWNFKPQFYVPGFVIWFTSISLGLFQKYKKRESMYFFFGLGILSLSAALLMLQTSNDPGIRALETWGLICQLIALFLFPLFVIRNFGPLLKQNLPIFKVIDKPQIIPTYIMYLGVLILGTSFVFALNGGAYHQITAAKYNADGELALNLKDPFLAEINFKQGLIHSKLNAKSNLSLARIAYQENKIEELAYYMSTSQVKFPSEQIAIALNNIYQKENHLFESLFALQAAHQKMPTSIEIAVQLAYTFEKLNQLDSAFYYHQLAFKNDPEESVSIVNYLYSLAKFNKKLSLPLIDQDTKDPAILANLWANGILNKTLIQTKALDNSIVPKADVRDLAMIYNSIPYFKDKQITLSLNAMANDSTIITLFPEIKLAEAMQDYFQHDPLSSMEKIALYINTQPTEQTVGLQSLLNFWHQSTLINKSIFRISNRLEAKSALKKSPFNLMLIQIAIPYLSKKEAYEATLAAIQWNKEVPEYYPMYAIQALEIGEIEYAKEAMNSLKKINESSFRDNLSLFENKLSEALQRQKF